MSVTISRDEWLSEFERVMRRQARCHGRCLVVIAREPEGRRAELTLHQRRRTPVRQVVAFRNLEEMVELCSESRANLVLVKVVLYSAVGTEPCALTLSFVSATKGQRPAIPPLVEC